MTSRYSSPFEALIVSGATVKPDETLTAKAARRMDTAIAAWGHGVAPNMVVTGNHSSFANSPPEVTEAEAMRRYAVTHGIPGDLIFVEDESLDTIGNALFTKTRIVEPQGWEHLKVVTSPAHMARALGIYRHVMGPRYDIEGLAVYEDAILAERAYELVATAITREILHGTKPGDDEAIQERLFDLVPGYGDSTRARLARRSLSGLVGIH